MKILKYFIVVAVLGGVVTSSANACRIEAQGIGFSFEENPTQMDLFTTLQMVLKEGHPNPGPPVFTGNMRIMTGLNQPIDVDGFAYAWAVYGPTKPGELYLGELYFIFEGPGKCEHMFPQFNFPDGHQPLVSVALFKAPDGGATAMLLVIALFGLGLAGRFGLRSVH